MTTNHELNAALNDLAQHLTDTANQPQPATLSEMTLRKWAIIVDLAAAHIDQLEQRITNAHQQLAATSTERDLWEREARQAG